MWRRRRVGQQSQMQLCFSRWRKGQWESTYSSLCSPEAANLLLSRRKLVLGDHCLQNLEGEIPKAVVLVVEQEN